MHWYVYVVYFFGGAFLANALPHLIAGVTGQRFHSPFASPPFIGLSSPSVNIVWALVNLAVAYLLLVQVNPLDIRSWASAGVCFAGFGTMAYQVPRSLARMRKRTAA